IGDGLNDDTDAIRHCIEQGDGRVVFSRGNYRITKTIEVELNKHGRTAFGGDGGLATLIMDGPGPALRLVGTHDKNADPKTYKPGVWESERMPTVTQLEIVGGHDESIGIQVEGTMQATIAGVLIRRCRYGIHLVKRNRNVLIADSHIYDGRGAAIGIYFDGVNLHQTNIVGCHISYHRHAGIKIQRSEIRNLQITGCDIEYNFDPAAEDCADVWIDSRESTVREGTITSCTIQARRSPGGCNVRIEGVPDELSRSAGLWTITGNHISSQDTNLLLRSCRAVVVSGNTFCSGYDRSIVVEKCRSISIGTNSIDYNPDYSGDRIDGVVIRDSSGIAVTGLVIEAARAGTPEEGGAVHIARASEVTVAGCQILDSTHRGLHLDQVKNVMVTGCTILTRQPQPTMREAIFTTHCGKDVVLQGNILGRGTQADVRFANGEPTVAGNVASV
ncbi:MAG: right-handed parallel beta-helix repeat-containing protein, partial [Chthoniobacteraceae bacterium]